MKLRVLASGSKGNSLAALSAHGTMVLVDLGLSYRELKRRAAACGLDLARAAGVLFTHDHVDHYAALATFRRHHADVPLLANGDTADAIAAKTGVGDGWSVFETAEPFDLGDFSVTPFSLSHDAADPVGFLLTDAADGATLFVGTDTGVVTTGVRAAYARATAAVLEANHDAVLLETSDRPVALKQRIAGRSGHLSNDDTAELVRSSTPRTLRILLLAHLSQQCNSPSLARAAVSTALADIGRGDVALSVLGQDEPSDLFEF